MGCLPGRTRTFVTTAACTAANCSSVARSLMPTETNLRHGVQQQRLLERLVLHSLQQTILPRVLLQQQHNSSKLHHSHRSDRGHPLGAPLRGPKSYSCHARPSMLAAAAAVRQVSACLKHTSKRCSTLVPGLPAVLGIRIQRRRRRVRALSCRVAQTAPERRLGAKQMQLCIVYY